MVKKIRQLFEYENYGSVYTLVTQINIHIRRETQHFLHSFIVEKQVFLRRNSACTQNNNNDLKIKK